MSSAQTRVIKFLFQALEIEHRERTGHDLRYEDDWRPFECDVCRYLEEARKQLFEC